MAFPTSPSNNDVHKEGNRAFVYDSALGVWDQVRETDRTEHKILQGEIGAGVSLPADVMVKNYNTTLAQGYSNSAVIDPNGANQGPPGHLEGIQIGSITGVPMNGTQKCSGRVNQSMGEWQADSNTIIIVWATKDSGATNTIMTGMNASGASSSLVCSWEGATLAAGNWDIYVRIGVTAAQTYGSWWGGAGVYGGNKWATPSKTRGSMTIQVGGTT